VSETERRVAGELVVFGIARRTLGLINPGPSLGVVESVRSNFSRSGSEPVDRGRAQTCFISGEQSGFRSSLTSKSPAEQGVCAGLASKQRVVGSSPTGGAEHHLSRSCRLLAAWSSGAKPRSEDHQDVWRIGLPARRVAGLVDVGAQAAASWRAPDRSVSVMGWRKKKAADEAPDPCPCLRCGAAAEGGFVTGSGNSGLWRFLSWHRGPLPRWTRGGERIDARFMGLARRPAHRCIGCRLIWFDY